MLIARHRSTLDWVHLRCIDIRMKSHRICFLCQEYVEEGEGIGGQIGTSGMGLRHVWCARLAAQEWVSHPDPLPTESPLTTPTKRKEPDSSDMDHSSPTSVACRSDDSTVLIGDKKKKKKSNDFKE